MNIKKEELFKAPPFQFSAKLRIFSLYAKHINKKITHSGSVHAILSSYEWFAMRILRTPVPISRLCYGPGLTFRSFSESRQQLRAALLHRRAKTPSLSPETAYVNPWSPDGLLGRDDFPWLITLALTRLWSRCVVYRLSASTRYVYVLWPVLVSGSHRWSGNTHRAVCSTSWPSVPPGSAG